MNQEMFSKVEEVADWFGENGYEILAEEIRYAVERIFERKESQ